MLKLSKLIDIFFATNNNHKVEEIYDIFIDNGIRIHKENIKGLEVQHDNSQIISENSVKQAFQIIRKPVFVEDSGLFIHSLEEFPGPFSSYVFSKIGVRGILKLLEGENNRAAEFRSVISYVDERGMVSFKGVVEGSIAEKARGDKGFGFDPIFIPKSHEQTFSELSLSQKNTISHRSKSSTHLVNWLKST